MSAGAAMAGATGLQMVGSIMQGQSTSASLRAQADLQEWNAQEALEQGRANAEKQELISAKKIGAAEANFGASGVSMNSGTVLDVLRESHSNAEMDRLNILHGADVKAINFRNQAALDRFGADSALRGSYWGAGASAASGAAKIYGRSVSSSPSTSTSEASGSEDGTDWGDSEL